jgi:hypothetical protein
MTPDGTVLRRGTGYSQAYAAATPQSPDATLAFNQQWAKPGPYVTVLPPTDEAKFQKWVRTNNVPFDPSPKADYDMRGYWKAMTSGDPNAAQQRSAFDGTMHFPDTYKTPYHKTFSGESQYATPGAPAWQGDRLVDQKGNVIADETPAPPPPPPPPVGRYKTRVGRE